MTWILKTCFCVLLCANIFCLKVNFERARVLYFNPKYMTYAWSNVTRYGRKSDYYINIEFVTKYVITNNITLNIKFYEFRWNTYKQSIAEFRYKLCDFFEKDPYIGADISAHGLKCPLKPGKYSVINVTTNMSNFPNAFPFEKGRANLLFNATSTGELIVEGELYLTFRNEFKSKKNG